MKGSHSGSPGGVTHEARSPVRMRCDVAAAAAACLCRFECSKPTLGPKR